MKIKLNNQDDIIYLCEYLLSIGYQCSVANDNISIVSEKDLPEDIVAIVEDIDHDRLHQLPYVQNKILDAQLDAVIEVEKEKAYLQNIIDNDSLPQNLRDKAQVRLDELES